MQMMSLGDTESIQLILICTHMHFGLRPSVSVGIPNASEGHCPSPLPASDVRAGAGVAVARDVTGAGKLEVADVVTAVAKFA